MIIMENLIPKVIDNHHQRISNQNLQGFVFIDQGWVGESGGQQEAHVDLTVTIIASFILQQTNKSILTPTIRDSSYNSYSVTKNPG